MSHHFAAISELGLNQFDARPGPQYFGGNLYRCHLRHPEHIDSQAYRDKLWMAMAPLDFGAKQPSNCTATERFLSPRPPTCKGWPQSAALAVEKWNLWTNNFKAQSTSPSNVRTDCRLERRSDSKKPDQGYKQTSASAHERLELRVPAFPRLRQEYIGWSRPDRESE